MLDHIAVRQSDVRTSDARSDFITSYRATAACTRELGRLHDEIVAALADWRARFVASGASIPEEPVVRRSPARCMVQLGPVALTVAWLQRAQGTVADGELLAVVWRGEVAMRTPQGFERSYERAGASSATALWETVLVATRRARSCGAGRLPVRRTTPCRPRHSRLAVSSACARPTRRTTREQ